MRALTIAIIALLVAAPATAARPSVVISDACLVEVEQVDHLRLTVSWAGQEPVATDTHLFVRFRGKRLVRTTVRLTPTGTEDDPPYVRPASSTGSFTGEVPPFVPMAPWWRYQDITLVDVSGLDVKGTPKRSGPWPRC